MLDYFYSYADNLDSGSGTLIIKTINISKVSENEM
jgi:hypothetical protein